jgi:hypothetical protein
LGSIPSELSFRCDSRPDGVHDNLFRDRPTHLSSPGLIERSKIVATTDELCLKAEPIELYQGVEISRFSGVRECYRVRGAGIGVHASAMRFHKRYPRATLKPFKPYLDTVPHRASNAGAPYFI